MNRVKFTDWIEDYADGSMDVAEMKKFEDTLAADKDLQFEYKLSRDLDRILGDEELLDFGQKCLAARAEQRMASARLVKVVQITRKYWYAIASLVVIAVIVTAALLIDPGSYSSEKLFRMYYKSGDAIGLSRSGNYTMAEALVAFSKDDFRNADLLFDEILANEPQNFAARYYAGISNIELKQFPKAIQMFEQIVSDQGNLYTEYAEWYLGLSYLAGEQPDKATGIFLIIAASPDHLYRQDAASILEKLNKGTKSKKIINR